MTPFHPLTFKSGYMWWYGNDKEGKLQHCNQNQQGLRWKLCWDNTYCFGKDTHELRKLMCEHGQHGSKWAKACCEEYEKWKLFLWVYRHLVKSWKEDKSGINMRTKCHQGEQRQTQRSSLKLLYVQGRSSLSAVSVHPG